MICPINLSLISCCYIPVAIIILNRTTLNTSKVTLNEQTYSAAKYFHSTDSIESYRIQFVLLSLSLTPSHQSLHQPATVTSIRLLQSVSIETSISHTHFSQSFLVRSMPTRKPYHLKLIRQTIVAMVETDAPYRPEEEALADWGIPVFIIESRRSQKASRKARESQCNDSDTRTPEEI